MVRMVLHDAQHSLHITIGGETKKICMCGLSSTKPFCDGAHRRTHDEEPGKIYMYKGEERIEVQDQSQKQ